MRRLNLCAFASISLLLPLFPVRVQAGGETALLNNMANPAPETLEIAAGTFEAGDAAAHWDAGPSHKVTISRPYGIGISPVSNAQYEEFDPAHRELRGRSRTPMGDNDPARFVTWEQANAYCQWLGKRENKHYRLPTEAEWEWAFRNHSDELRQGREVENWCLDWYGPYPTAPQTDPIGYVSGDFRVVRGGSWHAPSKEPGSRPAFLTRLGALPQDSNAAIGIRVVEAPPIASRALMERPTPRWAQDINQTKDNWKPTVDMGRSYFAEPRNYVKIVAGSNGPLFSQHNHDPALVACPNGDLLAVWYSTIQEDGRELLLAASRLRRGQSEWDEPSLFWDTPGRNDHAPSLWIDKKGRIYHFNGMAAEGGWNDLALVLRTSDDSGRTWSGAHFVEIERRHGNMPIPSVFQAEDGAIFLPCDENPSGKGGSVLHVSRDRGRTWMALNREKPQPIFADGQSGAWIAGIHTGVDQWTDGSFVAVGRGDTVNEHLAMSVSHDGGTSWTYSATPFPGIGGGQRPVLRRLKEGALLLVSFTPGSQFRNARGQQFEGQGMFAALSYDGGKTWPVQKLLTDGQERTFEGRGWTGQFTMDATHAEPKGYLAAIQAPDGMIDLISSGVHYQFNVAWLKQPAP